jgi:hypothetical protein
VLIVRVDLSTMDGLTYEDCYELISLATKVKPELVKVVLILGGVPDGEFVDSICASAGVSLENIYLLNYSKSQFQVIDLVSIKIANFLSEEATSTPN